MNLKQLETIFVNNQRQLFVAALSVTCNRELAEDAVHEALLAVASVTTEIEDLKAYLFRAVRNKSLQLASRQSRHSSLEEDYLDEVSCQHEETLFVQQVRKHIGDMDMNEKQTLILKLFEDMTFAEIAEITDNSPNTVASWYRRGLDRLKEKLDEQT